MKILIVEDEKSIARRTERLLREILADKIVSLQHKSRLEGALDYIKHHPIDVLFLDLNLSGKDGYQILRNVMAESFETIIISAYKDKAIEAFEYGVADFVPKPFDKARLEKALRRLEHKTANLKTLVVKKQGQLKLIPVNEIRFIKGANIYSEINIDLNKKELSNKSLDQLEQMLPEHFARIHKSYIADMNRAVEIIIQPGSKYELRLDNEEILPIGRTKYKDLKAKYFT